MKSNHHQHPGIQKTIWLLASVLVLGAPAWKAFGFPASPLVIYGEDNRQDLYQVQDSRLLHLADSTVALFRKEKISFDSAHKEAKLQLKLFGESRSLCKEEPFYEQKYGAFCSGSLVGKDLILTAGHCIETKEDCANTDFVFNFNVRAPGETPSLISADQVYECKEIVSRVKEMAGADYALIRLDREVPDHEPLLIDRQGDAPVGTSLVVIGHPSGLPTKVAGGAQVRRNHAAGYFVANLDTYGGNSGSAVFNAETGLIEGVLVRGENDYITRPGDTCKVSNHCDDQGCRGEDVTKISVISALIP